MSRSVRSKAATALVLLSCSVALAGCGKPKIPDHDDRPEPQAAPTAQAPSTLRQTMQQPIDKAKAAEDATAAAEAKRDEALNAATGE
jgi:hypothetical protein